MIVRELLTRLGFRIDDRNINIYNTTINNIHNNADRAAMAVQGLFAALAGFAALGAIAKVADETQSLEARIGQLPQTIGTAAESFDLVAKKATDARQGIDAYASFYIKAANATQDYLKSQEEVLRVVDGVAFGLAASGANAVSQGQALFQLGQAIGSPTVQMEELNTLIDVAPDLFRALGRAIPGANGNLKEFVGTGKVTGEMLAKGLMTVLPQFEQQFRNLPLTIGQASTIVANRWAVFINRMNRESGAVTSIANFFIGMFDKIEVGLAKMVDFFGGATNTLKFFGIAIAAALAPIVFNAAAGAIALLLSPMGLMFAGLVALGLAIEDFYKWMNGGESVFRKWLGPFDEAKKKLDEYSLVVDAVKIAVMSAVGVMVANWLWAAAVATYTAGWTAAIWLINLARFTGALIMNGIAVATWVGGVLVSLGTMVVGWIAGFISMAVAAAPIILTIVAVVAAIGLIVAAIYFLLDNWRTVFSMIKNIATLNFTGISDDFSKMVDKLKGYWSSFKSFFGAKVSTDISANSRPGNMVSMATVAGAASSPGGVPMAPTQGAPVSMTVNQTLPPGTPQETAGAAKTATERAISEFTGGALARQMGQVGG